MTKVLDALRGAKRLAQPKQAVKMAVERAKARVEGSHDLSLAERVDLLARYRATVGAKPAATEAHRARSEAIRADLKPSPRPHPRTVG